MWRQRREMKIEIRDRIAVRKKKRSRFPFSFYTSYPMKIELLELQAETEEPTNQTAICLAIRWLTTLII